MIHLRYNNEPSNTFWAGLTQIRVDVHFLENPRRDTIAYPDYDIRVILLLLSKLIQLCESCRLCLIMLTVRSFTASVTTHQWISSNMALLCHLGSYSVSPQLDSRTDLISWWSNSLWWQGWLSFFAGSWCLEFLQFLAWIFFSTFWACKILLPFWGHLIGSDWLWSFFPGSLCACTQIRLLSWYRHL